MARTIDHGAYQTQVHRMTFDALIGERKAGFVQVDWAPLDALPARIDKEIDADGDGQADFRLRVDTAAARSALTPYAPWVLELEGTYERKASLAVRVHLENPSRQHATHLHLAGVGRQADSSPSCPQGTAVQSGAQEGATEQGETFPGALLIAGSADASLLPPSRPAAPDLTGSKPATGSPPPILRFDTSPDPGIMPVEGSP